jgi:hypothetical protein
MGESDMSFIQLSKKWAPILLAQGETGMDYYVVSVILRDGRKFDQVIIVSNYITKVRGHKDIPFQESDIMDIKVTHDKWDWRTES